MQVTNKYFDLKEFNNNPTDEKMKALGSMQLKDIAEIFKSSSKEEIQKFESELIKANSKAGNELYKVF